MESAPRPPDGRNLTAADVPLPGGDFALLVTRLGVQGLLALGRIENPLTGRAQKNLPQARMLRADLAMLLEKTEGNLSALEEEHLRKVLQDLTRQLDEFDEGNEP